jgi:hypothetical protein
VRVIGLDIACQPGDEIELYEAGGQNVVYTFHRLRMGVKRVG